MTSTGVWTHPAFEAVASFVRTQTGIAMGPSVRLNAEAGIRRAMHAAKIADPAHYLERLKSGRLAAGDLYSELTVGESHFFREPLQFDYVRSHVLPDIVRRRGPEHRLRVWSAGCASGEEPYSLAILLEELGLSERAQLLATDISGKALADAQQAAYRQWSLRASDEAFIEHYFRREGERLVLADRIRRQVRFEMLNLAKDEYPSSAVDAWGMDVILCRNVLSYFEHETIRRVAERLFQTLAVGGWLIPGPSDPMLMDLAPFEVVMTPAGVFYRRPSAPDNSRNSQDTAPYSGFPGRDVQARHEIAQAVHGDWL